jgi:two-component system cell cycle sensor histidine kinase/response regulator CckA
MKFTISIRWALIAGFLTLIWGTHLITTTSSYITSQEVLHRHSRDIMQNIASLAMVQSRNHLYHAQGAAALTRQLLASNVVGNQSGQVEDLEKYFHKQLSINPHFAGIYIGTPNGDFYDVRHFATDSQDGYRTKLILNTTQGRTVHQLYRDDQFHMVSEEILSSDSYDPRKRPWYDKAVKESRIVWTDPYIFYTSKKPGITIAGPFFESSGKLKGVVGVDIEIDQLSIFIENLKIGKRGRAFMINRNADVVAFGNLEKLVVNDKDRTRLVKIHELDDPYSRKAFAAASIDTDATGMLVMDGSRFAKFTHEGKKYHAMLTPFSESKWPWIIGVYLPEEDYLGEIKKNRLENILLTVLISFAAAIMGIFLARGVTRPIFQLGKLARNIRRNEVSTSDFICVKSVYGEIQETAEAFSEMSIDVERNRSRFKEIFDNIQDVYYEASVDGYILEVSPSIENICSYQRDALIGMHMNVIYSDPKQREELIETLKEKGRVQDFEVLFQDQDGREIVCSLHSKMLLTKDGKPHRIIGSLRDVSDRKTIETALVDYKNRLEMLVEERTLELQRANDGLIAQIEKRRTTENKLRASEEKYRTILESIEEAYFEIDLTGRIMFISETACSITDYSTEELTGMHFRHLSKQKDSRNIIRTFRNLAKNGKPLANLHFPIQSKNGEHKVLALSAALTKDPSGRINGYRGLAHDITSEIAAQKEKERLQSQLNHAQRMEAVGTLAGGIAHDFNNLLMGITGNASLIRSAIQKDNTVNDYLDAIHQCVESGAALTNQLLGYARGGKYQVAVVDMNEAVKRTSEMFGRTKKQINIQTRFQEPIWMVKADQSQIDQVLLNLYVNAWHAMNDDLTLGLSTKNVLLKKGSTKLRNLPPGPYVSVRVTDWGKGIDPKIVKRIFEPFFTTKKMGRGTGLGLASSFGIVKNHDGIIDVESKLGVGTSFTVYLPATDATGKPPSPPVATVPQKASGTLLVVDDEPIVLRALMDMLKALGYDGISAENGRKAIDLIKEHPYQIDAVLLDMIMPDMNGHQVMKALRKIRPDIKIILSSGYSLEGLEKNEETSGASSFIQKPYHMKNLATVLNAVLGS